MYLTMVEGLNLNCTCVLCSKYLASGLIEKLRNCQNEKTMTVSADLVFDPLPELLYYVLSLDFVVG